MSPIASLVFAIIAVFAVAQSAPPKGNQTECQRESANLDTILRELILLNKQPKVAKTESQLKDWCTPFSSMSKRLSTHARCYKALPAQVLKMLASTLKRPYKFICRKNRKESLDSFSCITSDYIDRVHKRAAGFMHALKYIVENATQDDSLPLFCCNFADLVHAVEYEIPSPKCQTDDIHVGKFLGQRFDSALTDIFDLICGSYRVVKDCDLKVPKLMEIIRQEPPQDFDMFESPFLRNILLSVNKMS